MNKEVKKYLKGLIIELDNSLLALSTDIRYIRKAKNKLQKALEGENKKQCSC